MTVVLYSHALMLACTRPHARVVLPSLALRTSHPPLACMATKDEAAGQSIASYPSIFTAEDLSTAASELFGDGFLIIDGAINDAWAKQLSTAMDVLDDGFMLKAEENQGRDDFTRFVDEPSAMLPVQSAMQLLKGFGEALQPAYAAARAEGDWETILAGGKRAVPRTPATDERLLTAAPVAQLASYGPGGKYCVHSDNSRVEPGGPRRNERALTAIIYCTPSDWSEKDEGWLRIWKDSDEVDCNVEGPAELGSRLRADNAPHKDILPLSGRIVIFRSTLLHEVVPSKTRARRAITQWFFAPCENEA